MHVQILLLFFKTDFYVQFYECPWTEVVSVFCGGLSRFCLFVHLPLYNNMSECISVIGSATTALQILALFFTAWVQMPESELPAVTEICAVITAQR